MRALTASSAATLQQSQQKPHPSAKEHRAGSGRRLGQLTCSPRGSPSSWLRSGACGKHQHRLVSQKHQGGQRSMPGAAHLFASRYSFFWAAIRGLWEAPAQARQSKAPRRAAVDAWGSSLVRLAVLLLLGRDLLPAQGGTSTGSSAKSTKVGSSRCRGKLTCEPRGTPSCRPSSSRPR